MRYLFYIPFFIFIILKSSVAKSQFLSNATIYHKQNKISNVNIEINKSGLYCSSCPEKTINFSDIDSLKGDGYFYKVVKDENDFKLAKLLFKSEYSIYNIGDSDNYLLENENTITILNTKNGQKILSDIIFESQSKELISYIQSNKIASSEGDLIKTVKKINAVNGKPIKELKIPFKVKFELVAGIYQHSALLKGVELRRLLRYERSVRFESDLKPAFGLGIVFNPDRKYSTKINTIFTSKKYSEQFANVCVGGCANTYETFDYNSSGMAIQLNFKYDIGHKDKLYVAAGPVLSLPKPKSNTNFFDRGSKLYGFNAGLGYNFNLIKAGPAIEYNYQNFFISNGVNYVGNDKTNSILVKFLF